MDRTIRTPAGDLPRPPKPKRAPRLFKHPRSGYFSSIFYDPARRPRQKWHALQTTTKRRAERLHQQAEDAWFAGTFDPWRDSRADREHVSLATAVERYRDAMLAAGTWTPRTAGSRTSVLNRFAATLAPGLSPAHVLPRDVQAFLGDDQVRTAGTRRTYLSTMSALFAWCVAERLADDNPAAGLTVQRGAEPAKLHLRPEQLAALVRKIRGDANLKRATGKLRGGDPEGDGRQLVWLADVVELAAYTALRPSELHRLRWRDVDLPGRTLLVRNMAAGQTKTGRERSVPLATPAVAVLARLEAERPTENPDHPVILGARGPGIGFSVEVASRYFRSYAEAAGLPEGLTLYALRRTLPSWLASAGVSTAMAQRILGHASGRTTERHYAAVWDDATRLELDRAVAAVRG